MSATKILRVGLDIYYKCERTGPQEQVEDVLTAFHKLEPVILKAIFDNSTFGKALVDDVKVGKVEFATGSSMNLDGLRDFFRDNNMAGMADHLGQFGRVCLEIDPDGIFTVRFGS